MPLLRLSPAYPIVLLAAILFLCVHRLSSADVYSTEVSRAHEIVRRDLSSKVPGYSVSVAADGVCVWEENGGFSDIESHLPVTAETLFRIGSISKSVTSVGLMRLVEQGRLDLYAPIQKYVPEFPDKGSPIRIRDLAGHLSGIRDYRRSEALSAVHHSGYGSRLHVFEDDPLVTPPRTKFVYSGYNWILIEAAMARVSGKNFTSFIECTVLLPLGMSHTRAEIYGAADPKSATFYEVDLEGNFVLGPPIDPGFAWAVGGYLSTSHDLVTFGSALLRPGILSADSLQTLFETQTTSEGIPTGYGIGWYVYQKPRVFYHTGWTVGGLSVLLILPNERVVVAVVVNRGALNIKEGDSLSLNLESISFEIAKLFIDRTKH